MENTEDPNGKNQHNVVKMLSQPLKSYDGKLPRSKAYLAEAMDLVRRTISLSNQPNLTEEELLQRSMDWQDALEPEVPLHRVHDAFSLALRSHTGSFPVNAFDVLTAWRELSAVEQAERLTRRSMDRESERNLPFVPAPEGFIESMEALVRRKEMISDNTFPTK